MSERTVLIPSESDLIAVKLSISGAKEDVVVRPMGDYGIWVREELGGKMTEVDPADRRAMRAEKRTFKEYFFFKRTALSVGFGVGPFDIPDGVPKFRMRGTVNFEVVNPARLASFSHGECWLHAGELALLYGYRFDPQSGERGLGCYLRGAVLERVKASLDQIAGDHARESIAEIILADDFWTQCGVEARPSVGNVFFEFIGG